MFASDDFLNVVFENFIRVQYQLLVKLANKGRLHIGHMVSLMIFNSLGCTFILSIYTTFTYVFILEAR